MKTYFKAVPLGDLRVQSGTPVRFSRKWKALRYRKRMEKLGFYVLIECVDEQGQVIPRALSPLFSPA